MIFKLSKKYERDGLIWRMNLFVKMRKEKMILNQTESMGLKKILIKNFISAFGLEEISYLELDDAIEKFLDFRHFTIDLILDL